MSPPCETVKWGSGGVETVDGGGGDGDGGVGMEMELVMEVRMALAMAAEVVWVTAMVVPMEAHAEGGCGHVGGEAARQQR